MADRKPEFDKSALDGLEEEVAAARRGEPTGHFDARSALEGLDEEVAAARRGDGKAPKSGSVLDGLEEEVARTREERELPPASRPQSQD